MRVPALVMVMTVVSATAATAQFGSASVPPSTFATFWAGAYLEPGPVSDPTTGTTWSMGSAFGAGLGVHRQVGQGLVLGIDASFAPAVPFEYHRSESSARAIKGDDARLASATASGRLQYGGGGSFGLYLSGAAGAFMWGVPDLDPLVAVEASGAHWDTDLALLTGAGLEYRMSNRSALFIEWGRWWIFHQRGGSVSDNTNRFNGLKFGGRMGL